MDVSQYLNVFMDECQEHLQSLNQSLLALEQDPGKHRDSEFDFPRRPYSKRCLGNHGF